MAEHFAKREKEVLNGNITPDALIDYYDNWADNGYDEEVSPQVYRGPQMTAEKVASMFYTSARDNTEILDIGAGTGLLATQLRKYGFSKIDALEPSIGMLNLARKRNLYRNYYNCYLTNDAIPDVKGCFDCVLTCGCFVPGHLPPDSLNECLRFAKKDGKIVITKRANFGEPKYDKSLRSLMEELEVNGKWKKTLEIPVPNYYYDNVGVIYVFRVL
ncbi:Hypothetical predicted protein [Mytilus galloprovincialis]|uniref:Methyltransferase domain-containing protein n=1 Tax=Mytilus galloprovincialis TaxID=29158 RepID=A0A8B6DS15_MYTGA|nr:Hypothetical predicted protein [Mytilus galloprovincialis]